MIIIIMRMRMIMMITTKTTLVARWDTFGLLNAHVKRGNVRAMALSGRDELNISGGRRYTRS